MSKYILEKYSLCDGEQILYECHGKITLIPATQIRILVKNAIIFVTNKRIIAQGKLKTKFDVDMSFPVLDMIFGSGKKTKHKRDFDKSSTMLELPCYGHQFKTKNHQGLRKLYNGISYNVNIKDTITFNHLKYALVKITLINPNKESIDELFEVLRKDISQVINTIIELHEMDLTQESKGILYLQLLHPRLYFPFKNKLKRKYQGDEINLFSDSDYLELVKEIYKLDPDFFMTNIYPKMISLKYHKFLNTEDIIEKINTLLEKLSNG
jgi:hypothetical protein